MLGAEINADELIIYRIRNGTIFQAKDEYKFSGAGSGVSSSMARAFPFT